MVAVVGLMDAPSFEIDRKREPTPAWAIFGGEADHAQAKRRARFGASGKRTSRAFPQDGRLLTQPEAGARNGLFGGQEIQSLLHRP
jgi:hypothetical protein